MKTPNQIQIQSLRDSVIESQLRSLASGAHFETAESCVNACLDSYNETVEDYDFETIEELASELDIDFFFPAPSETEAELKARILEEYPSYSIYF